MKLAATLVAAVSIATGAAGPVDDPREPPPPIPEHVQEQRRTERFLRSAADAYALVAYMEGIKAEQQRADVEQQARVRSTVEHFSPDLVPAAPADTGSSGRCGGDLPPCSVMMRESGGDIRAENPNSSASGKWQFIDSTWNNYGGYSRASDAPEWVQDARAREVWAGGAGCGNWAPTDGCG